MSIFVSLALSAATGIAGGLIATGLLRRFDQLATNLVVGVLAAFISVGATAAFGLNVHFGLTRVDGLWADFVAASAGAMVGLVAWHQLRSMLPW
jgi:uncharacterized membrane protein YeaQ/YmgE (transglycosylase-associated protein family)